MFRVHLPQGRRATTRRKFTLNHYNLGVPGTHLIDIGRIKV